MLTRRLLDRAHKRINCIAVVAIAASLGANVSEVTAQGQNAAIERLIGSAVSDIGPEYRVIGDAIVRFGNRDASGAQMLLEQAKEDHLELPPVGVMMGQLYRASNNVVAARASLEQAVRDNPDDPEAYIHFADNALQKRRFTDAHLIYQRSREVCDSYELNPKRKRTLGIRALLGMAAVSEAREQWDKAEELLKQVATEDPDNSAAQTRLARAVFRQDRKTEAYKLLEIVYKMDSLNNPRAEISMAQLSQQAGDTARAKKLIGLARERDADSLKTQLAAARWAVQTGDLELAKDASNAATALAGDSSDVSIYLMEGFIARTEGEMDKAETALEQAHLISPGNQAVLNQLSALLVGQPEEAKRKRALEYARINSLIYNDRAQASGRNAAAILAWVTHQLGNTPEALRQLNAAMSSGGVTDADATYYMARIVSDSRPEAARTLLKPILDSRQIFPSRKEAEALLKKVGSG